MLIVVLVCVGAFAIYSMMKSKHEAPSANPANPTPGVTGQNNVQPGDGTDTGGGDSAYLTFGHDVCTRAQNGEPWSTIYFGSYEAFPDATGIDAYFMPTPALEAATQTIYPDQYDSMLSELGGSL